MFLQKSEIHNSVSNTCINSLSSCFSTYTNSNSLLPSPAVSVYCLQSSLHPEKPAIPLISNDNRYYRLVHTPGIYLIFPLIYCHHDYCQYPASFLLKKVRCWTEKNPLEIAEDILPSSSKHHPFHFSEDIHGSWKVETKIHKPLFLKGNTRTLQNLNLFFSAFSSKGIHQRNLLWIIELQIPQISCI